MTPTATLSEHRRRHRRLSHQHTSRRHWDRCAPACWTPADRGSLFAANLGWVDVPVREVIEDATELPTVLEDDANAAAWGEYRFRRRAQTEPHLVMVTVGTGIGGGIIVDGIDPPRSIGSSSRHRSHADGPGRARVRLREHGAVWSSTPVGARWLGEVRDRCTDQPSRASLVLSLGDGTLQGIRGEHVTEAARLGDPLAVRVLREDCQLAGTWTGHPDSGLGPWVLRPRRRRQRGREPPARTLASGISDGSSRR